jgi:hypothetical protein
MDYPKDFPEDLKNPVEEAIARAEATFQTKFKNPKIAVNKGFEGLVFDFVEKVFFVFLQQAREAAKRGDWTLEQVRLRSAEYLHNLIVDAYSERNPSRKHDGLFFFEEKATEEIYASRQWVRHQRAIVGLAKAASDVGQAVKAKEIQAIDRKALRDSYRVAFPNEKILDICWAARQHYSEWKRWIRNAVKDGSAPDRGFRALLTSGKSCAQYRKQPRPEGWK